MALDLPGLAFPLVAGIFSLFSPCGYALLPGYISYYLGSRLHVRRAVSGGLVCTLGLMTIFILIGGSASILGALLPQIIPILNLAASAILIIMGITTLIGMEFSIPVPVKAAKQRGLLGIYIFGVAYGLAAAGCSAPIFLSILFYSMAGGPINGAIVFLTYAVGMGLPLIITSILVAEAKELMIRKIADFTPSLRKISGATLISVGIYLLYFYYITYM